jgi:hypothetical protein
VAVFRLGFRQDLLEVGARPDWFEVVVLLDCRTLTAALHRLAQQFDGARGVHFGLPAALRFR